jgi:hypothetical protein
LQTETDSKFTVCQQFYETVEHRIVTREALVFLSWILGTQEEEVAAAAVAVSVFSNYTCAPISKFQDLPQIIQNAI